MLVPSNGLPSTNVGVIGVATGGAALSAASCSMNAENRICNPAVPCSDATLPASVEMSYRCVWVALPALAVSISAPMAAQASVTSAAARLLSLIVALPSQKLGKPNALRTTARATGPT